MEPPRHLILIVVAGIGCGFSLGSAAFLASFDAREPPVSAVPIFLTAGFLVTFIALFAWRRPAIYAVVYTMVLGGFAALLFIAAAEPFGLITVSIYTFYFGPFLLGAPYCIAAWREVRRGKPTELLPSRETGGPQGR